MHSQSLLKSVEAGNVLFLKSDHIVVDWETHSEKRCFRASASQSKACGQHVALKTLAIGKKKWKMREMLIIKYITLVGGHILPTVPKRCSFLHISFFCFWYADNNQYFNLLCLVDIQITLIKEHQNRREIFGVDQCHWIMFTTWELQQSQLLVRMERVDCTVLPMCWGFLFRVRQ